MKADDGDDAARLQTIGQRLPQKRFKLFEFAVDGNSQGLKDTGCRVLFARRAPCCALWRRDCVGQIASRDDWAFAAALDDSPGDSPAVGFFAETVKQVGQAGLVDLGEQLGGWHPVSDVET